VQVPVVAQDPVAVSDAGGGGGRPQRSPRHGPRRRRHIGGPTTRPRPVGTPHDAAFSFTLHQLNSTQLDGTGRRRIPVHIGPDLQTILRSIVRLKVKVKGSPYSITERRVPELIPVLGSQPAGDVSHKPGGRLPLLAITFRQACSYPRNP